jgi:hypothetical protein
MMMMKTIGSSLVAASVDILDSTFVHKRGDRDNVVKLDEAFAEAPRLPHARARAHLAPQ